MLFEGLNSPFVLWYSLNILIMHFFSHDFIYFIRALLFGIAIGYAVFYFFLYFKPVIEDIAGAKKFNVDLWWMMTVTVSIVAGVIGFILLI